MSVQTPKVSVQKNSVPQTPCVVTSDIVDTLDTKRINIFLCLYYFSHFIGIHQGRLDLLTTYYSTGSKY